MDIPPSLKTAVVFDQSVFVKGAIKNLLKEALIGLVLTGLMILLFLGSRRALPAHRCSRFRMSILLCLLVMNALGGTINTMLLGGHCAGVLAPDRQLRRRAGKHLPLHGRGRAAGQGSDEGGSEVSLAVLAATVATSIVFFPVFLLNGVSRYLFTDLALGVVICIFASYFFSMTLVPLFCAKFINLHEEHGETDTGEKKRLHLPSHRGPLQHLLSAHAGALRGACLPQLEAARLHRRGPARRHRGHPRV